MRVCLGDSAVGGLRCVVWPAGGSLALLAPPPQKQTHEAMLRPNSYLYSCSIKHIVNNNNKILVIQTNSPGDVALKAAVSDQDGGVFCGEHSSPLTVIHKVVQKAASVKGRCSSALEQNDPCNTKNHPAKPRCEGVLGRKLPDRLQLAVAPSMPGIEWLADHMHGDLGVQLGCPQLE